MNAESGPPGSGQDKNWTRALMASSGVVVPTDAAPRNPVRMSSEVREAQHESLTRERLHFLVKHKDPAVREAIAARKDAPLGALIALGHDRALGVRICVAANQHAPMSIIEMLSHDRDERVLKAVIRNASTPFDVVHRLAFHKREDVRRVATRRIDDADDFATHEQVRAPELQDDWRPRAAASTESTPVPAVEGEAPQVLAPRPEVPSRTQSNDPATSEDISAAWLLGRQLPAH